MIKLSKGKIQKIKLEKYYFRGEEKIQDKKLKNTLYFRSRKVSRQDSKQQDSQPEKKTKEYTRRQTQVKGQKNT
jgi:hypothetical protein